jgi:hypothetical protein
VTNLSSIDLIVFVMLLLPAPRTFIETAGTSRSFRRIAGRQWIGGLNLGSMLWTGDDDHATVILSLSTTICTFQETGSFYPALRKPSKMSLNKAQRRGNTNLNYDVAFDGHESRVD